MKNADSKEEVQKISSSALATVREDDPAKQYVVAAIQETVKEFKESDRYKRLLKTEEQAEEKGKNGKSGAANIIYEIGEHITEAEKKYIAIYGNQNDIYKVECQKRKQALEQEFSSYLETIGVLGKEFSIHLETGEEAVVGGLDAVQNEQVENYIEVHWEQFKNVYLAASKECAEMTNQEYRIAGYVEECNQFLANVSGGKVTVDNLSLERKVAGWYINHENIVGLPPAIANALNSAESTDKYYDYKQMLHNILNYKQEHGEIPQYHMNFNWSGKELQC